MHDGDWTGDWRQLWRAQNVTATLTPDERAPLRMPVPDTLPPEIAGVVGEGAAITPMRGGLNLVFGVEGESSRFVAKIARGAYRIQEMRAERRALTAFRESGVPVPAVRAWVEDAEWAWLVMDRAAGEPLRDLLPGAHGDRRLRMATAMGAMLALVHGAAGGVEAVSPRLPEAQVEAVSRRLMASVEPQPDWSACLEAQLRFAARHLEAGVLDPEEFQTRDAWPAEPRRLLEELRRHRPAPGRVVTIHGDWRPKNLLWSDDTGITAVLDWAFVDLADPYYDLATILWYLPDATDRHAFLAAYGVPGPDPARLRYYDDLLRFTSV